LSTVDPILDAALEHRLITRKQCKHIADEIEMWPDRSARALLLEKHFVTQEQLEQLESTMGGGGGSSTPQTATPVSAPPAPQAPPQPVQSDAPRQPPPGPPRTQPAPPTAPAPREAPAEEPAPPTMSAPGTSSPRTLKDFLRLARHWGASDLHLAVGRPPFVRMNGNVRYMELPPLSPEDAEALNFSLLTEEQRARLVEDLNLDFALDLKKAGRYRCNVYRQRLGWDGCYRVIAAEIPTFEKLGLPPALKALADFHQGLVLVTGPARSGKTSTCAAMIDLVNRGRTDHVITVEDPVEFIHRPQKCQVTQREVGAHTSSFAVALRAALREDPDIILVGELRDMETISIAITAAETGHLVFGTLHTSGAGRTISRILDVFPVKQREQITTMISESIRGIVSQRLLPRADGAGLVLALEVMVTTSSVSSLIREQKLHQLVNVMQAGKRLGMQTMDDHLMELAKTNLISGDEAWRVAENKSAFESLRSAASRQAGEP